MIEDEDKTYDEVRQKFKFTKTGVGYFCRKHGIKSKRKGFSRPKIIFTLEQTKQIIEDYTGKNLNSINAIAHKYSVSGYAVRRLLSQNNVSIRPMTYNIAFNTVAKPLRRVGDKTRKRKQSMGASPRKAPIIKYKKKNGAGLAQAALLPEHQQCKYITNDMLPFTFCTEKAIERKPYCLKHYKKCHVKRID